MISAKGWRTEHAAVSSRQRDRRMLHSELCRCGRRATPPAVNIPLIAAAKYAAERAKGGGDGASRCGSAETLGAGLGPGSVSSCPSYSSSSTSQPAKLCCRPNLISVHVSNSPSRALLMHSRSPLSPRWCHQPLQSRSACRWRRVLCQLSQLPATDIAFAAGDRC